MSELLYAIIERMTAFHNWVLTLNDRSPIFLTDKQLHFLIMGIAGLVLLLVLHPLFSWLAEREHTFVITGIYVCTVMLVVTFAIEVGQGVTGTGGMEVEDIVAGMAGFLAAFVLFALLRAIWHGIRRKH